ncbi:MAG: glycosyltransferase family 39 protein [Chloroflexota bacterium]
MFRSWLRDVRFWAAALLLLGGGLRLFDLFDQPIDFHPTRQLRGMIVARGMYYQMLPDADPLLRQLAMNFWSSTGQYEPSILERLAALTYLAAGREVFWVARVYNTLFWLVGGLALFALARRLARQALDGASGAPPGAALQPEPAAPAADVAALAALAFYLVLPFSVQASRSFQPDPAMTAWMALAALALARWSEQPTWPRALAAGLLAGLAILTKAVSIYPMAGMLLAGVFYTYGLGRDKPFYRPLLRLLGSPQVWAMGLLSLGPVLLYYLTRQARASEFFSTWTMALSHLLLEPKFYAGWLALAAELVTPPALLLALLGVWLARGRGRWMLVGLWLGYIAYGLFLPYQMDTHSYYHLQLAWLVPLSMAPALGRGAAWLLQRSSRAQLAGLGLALALLAFGAWQALVPFYGQDFSHEPAYWSEIAAYLPVDGKIVALTQDYGYRLMYYGWRKVVLWPNRGELKLSSLRGSSKEFDAYFAKRTEGKRYFLITAFRQYQDQPALVEMLTTHYPLVAQAEGYLIFDLQQAH